jgi:hypothetical protein
MRERFAVPVLLDEEQPPVRADRLRYRKGGLARPALMVKAICAGFVMPS